MGLISFGRRAILLGNKRGNSGEEIHENEPGGKKKKQLVLEKGLSQERGDARGLRPRAHAYKAKGDEELERQGKLTPDQG